MEKDTSNAAITQNLKDAGCERDTIENFMEYAKEDKVGEQLKLLVKHRCLLLDKVHEEQKKIDCLDYLIYQIQKQRNERKKTKVIKVKV